jgi:Zn-dependent protease with chaperone function
VQAAAERCAERLHIALPTVYVTPAPLAGGVLAWTFGGGDDPAILLHASLAERLRGGDLDDVLGRECGHVQNDHVLYRTALYFLTHAAGRFVRWIVKPATMALEAWHKRAEVTGDRAGLLCSRELDASLRGLAAVHTNAVAPAARAEALKLFASSAYYLGIIGQTGGLTADECDARVAQVLK